VKEFLGLLLIVVVIGQIVEHWHFIVLVFAVLAGTAVLGLLGVQAGKAWKRAHKERQDQADMARAQRSRLEARARHQNDWFLEGDSRGVYGEFPPVDLDKL